MVLMREMEGDRHRGMDAHTVSAVALTCITCVFCPSRERESETYGWAVRSDKRVLHACSVPAGIRRGVLSSHL